MTLTRNCSDSPFAMPGSASIPQFTELSWCDGIPCGPFVRDVRVWVTLYVPSGMAIDGRPGDIGQYLIEGTSVVMAYVDQPGRPAPGRVESKGC